MLWNSAINQAAPVQHRQTLSSEDREERQETTIYHFLQGRLQTEVRGRNDSLVHPTPPHPTQGTEKIILWLLDVGGRVY